MDQNEILEAKFKTKLNGYSCVEVDAFLDRVAEAMEELRQNNSSLEKQLQGANQELSSLKSLETTLRDALVTAHQSAGQIVEEARAQAKQIVEAAQAQADSMLADAVEKQGKLDEIDKAIQRYKADVRSMMGEQLDALDKYFSELQ